MYSEGAKGLQTQRPTDLFVSLGGTSYQIKDRPTIEFSWKGSFYIIKKIFIFENTSVQKVE